MSREKQIEVMAGILASDCGNCAECDSFHKEINGIDACYHKYAEMIYNAGYRKQAWISVEERLPKEGVRVLVWLKGDNSQYTSIDTDRISLKKWVRWGRLVTHWMELPEPPKGE